MQKGKIGSSMGQTFSKLGHLDSTVRKPIIMIQTYEVMRLMWENA